MLEKGEDIGILLLLLFLRRALCGLRGRNFDGHFIVGRGRRREGRVGVGHVCWRGGGYGGRGVGRGKEAMTKGARLGRHG